MAKIFGSPLNMVILWNKLRKDIQDSNVAQPVLKTLLWLIRKPGLVWPFWGYCVVCVQSLSRVWLLAAPWNVAHQAPLSMGFSSQEYWSGLLYWVAMASSRGSSQLRGRTSISCISCIGRQILYHCAISVQLLPRPKPASFTFSTDVTPKTPPSEISVPQSSMSKYISSGIQSMVGSFPCESSNC